MSATHLHPNQSAKSSPKQLDVPLVDVHPNPSSSFPSGQIGSDIPESSSSLLTHSDKLTALPSRSRVGGSYNRAPRSSDLSLPWENNSSSQQPGQLPLQLVPTRASAESERSVVVGKETPKQRVSFDSVRENKSLPSFQNVRQAAARVVRSATSSEHGHSSPPSREPPRRGSNDSHSPSRGQSPLGRILWPLHRLHSREEPFIPRDPYQFTITRNTVSHAFSQCVRQVYLHLLLRLPSTYFSRVCRLFEDADVSKQEIARLIERVANGEEFPKTWNPPTVTPALSRFKDSWEEFVAQVLREWKTLNVVSALLLSAILTMFQITDAANDPITRTSALLSLIAALWSLSFGCTYIIRFGTMKSMYKASRWAEEAQKSKTSIWWNVWVLLATPAVWLAWSMIAFCVSILAFVWRTGSSTDNPQPLSPRDALGPRIAVSCLFLLGCVNYFLVLRTFKSYGGGRPRVAILNLRNLANININNPAAAANLNVLGNLNINNVGGNNGGGGQGVPLGLADVLVQAASMQQRVSETTTSTDLEKGRVFQVERGRRISPRL